MPSWSKRSNVIGSGYLYHIVHSLYLQKPITTLHFCLPEGSKYFWDYTIMGGPMRKVGLIIPSSSFFFDLSSFFFFVGIWNPYFSNVLRRNNDVSITRYITIYLKKYFSYSFHIVQVGLRFTRRYFGGCIHYSFSFPTL